MLFTNASKNLSIKWHISFNFLKVLTFLLVIVMISICRWAFLNVASCGKSYIHVYVYMNFSLGIFFCFTSETEVGAVDKWLFMSRVVVIVKLRQIHSCNLIGIVTMKCFQKIIHEQQCISKQQWLDSFEEI